MICLVSRSARKLRPEPIRPSNASRYQTSRVQRTWSLSQGGVHDTASRSPRYVGRDGEAATSFWYSSQVWTSADRGRRVARCHGASPRRGQPAAPDLPRSATARSRRPRRRRAPSKSGTSNSGYLSRSAIMLEPIVERLVAGLERVLAVVAVDAQDQVLRRQPVVPVDDRDRARVVVAEPRQRRQRGRDAGRRALLREQALVGDPRMQPDLLGNERAQIGRHVASNTITSAVDRALERVDQRAESVAIELEPRRVDHEPARTCATVSISTSPFWRSVSPVCVISTMRSHSPVSGPSSIAPDSLMTSAVMPFRCEVRLRRARILRRDPEVRCARSSTRASARSRDDHPALARCRGRAARRARGLPRRARRCPRRRHPRRHARRTSGCRCCAARARGARRTRCTSLRVSPSTGARS